MHSGPPKKESYVLTEIARCYQLMDGRVHHVRLLIIQSIARSRFSDLKIAISDFPIWKSLCMLTIRGREWWCWSSRVLHKIAIGKRDWVRDFEIGKRDCDRLLDSCCWSSRPSIDRSLNMDRITLPNTFTQNTITCLVKKSRSRVISNLKIAIADRAILCDHQPYGSLFAL